MPVRRRTFRYNRVYILAVGAGAPTLQFRRLGIVPFSLAGGNHGRMTCGRATGNHKIAEKICLFQPLIKIVISEYRNLNCYA